jgi:hypothetical protein
LPPGSASGALMIRSAKPSPFTSPAEATEVPLKSLAATPVTRKPLLPSSADRSGWLVQLALPKTT